MQMQSDDLGAKKKTKITLDFRFLFYYIITVIIIIIKFHQQGRRL